MRFFDIGANLSHQNFEGIYNDKKLHEGDLEEVLQRCKDYRVDKLLLAGASYEDMKKCAGIISNREGTWTTVGIHPCHAGEVF